METILPATIKASPSRPQSRRACPALPFAAADSRTRPRRPSAQETTVALRNSLGVHTAVLLLVILLASSSSPRLQEMLPLMTVDLCSFIETETARTPHPEPSAAPGNDAPPVLRPAPAPTAARIATKRVVKQSPPVFRPLPPPPVTTSLASASVPAVAPEADRQAQGQPGAAQQEVGEHGTNSADQEGRPGRDARTAFALQEVEHAPVPLQTPEPVFPPTARRLGVNGKVVVKFLVTAAGTVAQPSVVTADPEAVFDRSALEAVMDWRFRPGRLHGEAVATWVVVPIRFTLTR